MNALRFIVLAITILSSPIPTPVGSGFTFIAVADAIQQREVFLRVAVLLVDPYVMLKKNLSSPLSEDPSQYTGFLVELLNHITDYLGINYRIYQVEDGQYGFLHSDGSWDGLIGELVNKRADLAASPLFITQQRRDVIDFSQPFLNVRASLILRKDSPKIEKVTDLLTQRTLTYGVQRYSMVSRALKRSNNSEFKQLWQNIKSFSPSALTRTAKVGIERALNGRYAFILPSTLADYIVRRKPCDLKRVGDFLMDEGYGFGLQKGSDLLPQLNRVLFNINRTGILQHLYTKYWIKHSDCDSVSSSRIYHNHNGNNHVKSAISLLVITLCIVIVLIK